MITIIVITITFIVVIVVVIVFVVSGSRIFFLLMNSFVVICFFWSNRFSGLRLVRAFSSRCSCLFISITTRCTGYNGLSIIWSCSYALRTTSFGFIFFCSCIATFWSNIFYITSTIRRILCRNYGVYKLHFFVSTIFRNANCFSDFL